MRDPDVMYATLVVIVLALAQTLAGQAGTTYYVSINGNDTNPGTIRAPWLTIQNAANTLKPGATVYVSGGIFRESVNFPTSGRALAPIIFQSYPGQTSRGVPSEVIHCWRPAA
jgi:hypothetical protein